MVYTKLIQVKLSNEDFERIEKAGNFLSLKIPSYVRTTMAQHSKKVLNENLKKIEDENGRDTR